MLWLGIAGALLCALCTNVGFLLKHRGASQEATVCFRNPLGSAKALFSNRIFLIGWLVGGTGFLFHVLAMATAPMTVVKVLTATGIIVLAVGSDIVCGQRPHRLQWYALGALALGLVGIVLSVKPAYHTPNTPQEMMIAFVAGAAAVAVFCAHRRLRSRGIGLALIAGIAWGVGDVIIKYLASHGLDSALAPFLLPVVLGCFVGGFLTSSRAYQQGEALPVIALSSMAANLTALTSGFVLFSDSFVGVTGMIIGPLALLVIVAAAMMIPAPGLRHHQPRAA